MVGKADHIFETKLRCKIVTALEPAAVNRRVVGSSPTGGAKNREIFNSEATVCEDCHFVCELSISLFLLYHVVLRLSWFFRTIFASYVLRIFETAILSVGLSAVFDYCCCFVLMNVMKV